MVTIMINIKKFRLVIKHILITYIKVIKPADLKKITKAWKKNRQHKVDKTKNRPFTGKTELFLIFIIFYTHPLQKFKNNSKCLLF